MNRSGSPVRSFQRYLYGFRTSTFLLHYFVCFFRVPLERAFSIFLYGASNSYFQGCVLLGGLFGRYGVDYVVGFSSYFMDVFGGFSSRFLFHLGCYLTLSRV